ncbi:MAG: Uma2 family endonuclease [Phormidium tanganyikae FI6-MK23]|jgi:Uma2 family endonuclease|nr:Uma2 family endonuclease [Phormidium tanganyikae FI6-MK23]
MTATIPKPSGQSTEQRFVRTGVSWEDFKAIQQGFANSPSVRLFYFRGELEILGTSPEHEIVKGNIGFLVEDYMLTAGLEFVATGSFSQEREDEAAAQADESYCFDEQKSIPDLAIEVVITSGGPSKLKRYKALGVKEVWFWEDGVIEIHYLEGDSYNRIKQSRLLPNLNTDHLAMCAAIPSRPEAVRQFRAKTQEV